VARQNDQRYKKKTCLQHIRNKLPRSKEQRRITSKTLQMKTKWEI